MKEGLKRESRLKKFSVFCTLWVFEYSYVMNYDSIICGQVFQTYNTGDGRLIMLYVIGFGTAHLDKTKWPPCINT